MASKKNRDEFSGKVKDALAKQAGYLCSNPQCRRATIGPSAEGPMATTSIGEAAHITAAAPGPGARRYDPSISSEQRASIQNAIWLCNICSKLIDRDEKTYTVSVLNKWKEEATEHAKARIAPHPGAEEASRVAPKISREKLVYSARTLLEMTSHASENPHLPIMTSNARAALSELREYPRRVLPLDCPDPDSTDSLAQDIDSLIVHANREMLTGPSGAGKSCGVADACSRILAAEVGPVPFYLSLKAYATWDSASGALCQLLNIPDLSILQEVGHAIILVIDDCHRLTPQEMVSVLLTFSKSGIVAIARPNSLDDRFAHWKLLPLDDSVVSRTLLQLQVKSTDMKFELFRNPFPIVLLAASGSHDANVSQAILLRRLHEELCGQNPERIRLIAYAVTELEIAGNRSAGRFLDALGTKMGDDDGFGTVYIERGMVHAIHDLCWDWLVGYSVLHELSSRDPVDTLKIPRLADRLALAGESGIVMREYGNIHHILECDALIGAIILKYSSSFHGKRNLQRTLVESTSLLTRSEKPTDCCRGIRVQSVLRSSFSAHEMTEGLLRAGLFAESGHSFYDEIEDAIDPELLWSIAPFLPKLFAQEKTRIWILRVLAERGDVRWGQWAQQHRGSLLTDFEAAYVSICCEERIAEWVAPYLGDVLQKQQYRLFPALGKRGVCGEMLVQSLFDALVLKRIAGQAHSYFAIRYFQGLRARPDGGRLLQLISAEEVVDPSMVELVRAVRIDHQVLILDEISRKTGAHPPSIVQDAGVGILQHIPDSIASGWIDHHHYRWQILGWRVMALRKLRKAEEFIAAMPHSFDSVDVIPALSGLAVFQDVIDDRIAHDILGRFRGAISPMVADATFQALAATKVGPLLVARMVMAMPTYTLGQFAKALATWRSRFGMDVHIQIPGSTLHCSLGDWLVSRHVLAPQEPQLLGRCVRDSGSSVARRVLLLRWLETGDSRLMTEVVLAGLPREVDTTAAEKIVTTLNSYEAANLLSEWIPQLESDILIRLWRGADERFRNIVAIRCFAMSSSIHYFFHLEIIAWIECGSAFDVDFLRSFARAIRVHGLDLIRKMVPEPRTTLNDSIWWLVRRLEWEAGVGLITDKGEWL